MQFHPVLPHHLFSSTSFHPLFHSYSFAIELILHGASISSLILDIGLASQDEKMNVLSATDSALPPRFAYPSSYGYPRLVKGQPLNLQQDTPDTQEAQDAATRRVSTSPYSTTPKSTIVHHRKFPDLRKNSPHAAVKASLKRRRKEAFPLPNIQQHPP
jgi:hypothetical protein